jgi:hypothetical protein
MYGLTHEMHGTQGMLKTCVQRSRIDIMRQSDLFDPSEPLEIPVFDQVKDKVGWDGDEPIYRIIEDFTLIHEEFRVPGDSYL